MKRTKPSGKTKKLVESLVGEEPGLASAARLFFYQSLYPNDDLYKLEVLASVLNDVAPDSPNRSLAELIERLVTRSPAKQEWVRQKELADIVGPTPCTPAPGSPLYCLNQSLAWNPCFLRIEGSERANGAIDIRATHVPIPALEAFGLDDGTLSGEVKLELGPNLESGRILWLLWKVFDRRIDLTRLKNCSVCHTWFVDHSKNKTKVRCSAACTSQRWSWAERKKAGHSQPAGKAKGGKHAKAKKA